MSSKKFRPAGFNLKQKMFYIKRRESESYNWAERRDWHYKNAPPNHKVLSKIFSKLHYLGSHSPTSLRKKWHTAEHLFYQKHFGSTKKQSCRYANNWTCHRWL